MADKTTVVEENDNTVSTENDRLDKDKSPRLKDRSNSIFGVDRIDPMFGGGGRDWSVDVLRCLSCFLVCVIHSTDMTKSYNFSGLGDNPWLHHEVYRMAVSSPTVLFVMVSGIFFLSPERNVTASRVWKKNVLKMASAYVFWCLVYAIYRIYMVDPNPVLTSELLIQEWMIQQVHLWYIPMIIGLYIICPIIRPITATYDTKLFAYIICVFMGGMVLWTIYYWPRPENVESMAKLIIEKTPMALICQYPFWMMFGWIAYTYRPRIGLRIIIYIVGIIAMIIGMYANINAYMTLETLDFTAVTQKFGIFQFLKNVALFYFIVTVFRNHNFSRIGKMLLKKWSDCTLIIYLIHYIPLYIMSNNHFLFDDGVSPWIGVWIYAVIAYIGSGIVAVLFHLFWDPIKKDLDSREKRSEKIYKRIEKKKNRM